jgi:hypothetical protein
VPEGVSQHSRPAAETRNNVPNRSEAGLSRRAVIVGGLGLGILLARPRTLLAHDRAVRVEPQSYFAHVERIMSALQALGEPFPTGHQKSLLSLAKSGTEEDIARAEEILHQYTLAYVQLEKDGTARTRPGRARRELVEQGWRCFLVRIENPFGVHSSIDLQTGFEASPRDSGVITSEGSVMSRLGSGNDAASNGRGYRRAVAELSRSWMGYSFFTSKPLASALSGLGLEYLVLQLFSRDRGERSAFLAFQAAVLPAPVRRGAPLAEVYSSLTATKLRKEGSGFATSFECLPSIDVVLDIKDHDGASCTASVLVTDKIGRLYPAPTHRIAPDLRFHPQVYRATGESVRLPVGQYQIEARRGPEYLRTSTSVAVTSAADSLCVPIQLERWINAAALDWYPGDTHIHAAGCSHYETPTMGVTPETMIRHVRGEALAVGDVLTWAPGYSYQRQFNTGRVYAPSDALEFPELQRVNNRSFSPKHAARDSESIVRYDVEVSGFPSSSSGHLVLLGLSDPDYPGARSIEEWPSWNLPILKWAKGQGCVTGYAHCGVGMVVDSGELPNYEIPPFDLVGANEFIVDVTHGVVDFMSGAQMDPVAELTCWYHTLNCGFHATMVGETDFPCFFDERVGHGRTYVGLPHPPIGDKGYAAWVEGIRQGRLYFGDGRSHFLDYRINDQPVGGADVQLEAPGKVCITVRLAARLEPRADSVTDLSPWHIEHARMGHSRAVLAEVVVNGRSVAAEEISADGRVRPISVWVDIERSSWVALRILPSGHTHPIFVRVAGRPVRASRRSAQWCLECVDALWREKSPQIADAEQKDAAAAYDEARRIYKRVLHDCDVD